MENTTWKACMRSLLLLTVILLLLNLVFPPLLGTALTACRDILNLIWNLQRSQWLQRNNELLQTTCNKALMNVTNVAHLWHEYLGAILVHLHHHLPSKRVAKTERSRSASHQKRDGGMKHNLQIEDRIGIACQDYSDVEDDPGLEWKSDGMSLDPLNHQVSIHFIPANQKKQKSHGISPSDTSSLKDEPFTGMLLQVYQNNNRFNLWDVSRADVSPMASNQKVEVEISGHTLQSIHPIDIESTINVYHKPCQSLQEYSHVNGQVDFNEYQLLEQTHGDLGVIDIYSLDFAYRPVAPPLASLPARSSSPSWTYEYSKGFAYEKLGNRAFAGGSHGEVWKARRRCNLIVNVEAMKKENDKSSDKSSEVKSSTKMCDDSSPLIMKRLKVNQGLYFMEAGLREIYFGEILARSDGSESLFTTLVDHFYRRPTTVINAAVELWIVFENAGPSLRSYIYTPVNMGDFVIYQHSDLWRNLRLGIEPNARKDLFSVAIVSGSNGRHNNVKDSSENKEDGEIHREPKDNLSIEKGRSFFRKILKQILTSAAKLHSWGIVHRGEMHVCQSIFVRFIYLTFSRLPPNRLRGQSRYKGEITFHMDVMDNTMMLNLD